MKIHVRAIFGQLLPIIKREFVTLLLRIIGETLKDRIIRLIIIGALGSYGVDLTTAISTEEPTGSRVEKPAE